MVAQSALARQRPAPGGEEELAITPPKHEVGQRPASLGGISLQAVLGDARFVGEFRMQRVDRDLLGD
jgi:hypothetical protein